jgi:hypothetical protein
MIQVENYGNLGDVGGSGGFKTCPEERVVEVV